MDTEHSIIPFKVPFTGMVVGQTMSGKSFFIGELLHHTKELFEKSPVDILYVYKVWDPRFEQMQKEIPNIEFTQELPSKQVSIFMKYCLCLFSIVLSYEF